MAGEVGECRIWAKVAELGVGSGRKGGDGGQIWAGAG